MAKVVGVRFRNVGKIYYFDPKEYEIRLYDHVIVETARGMEYGKVVMPPKEIPDEEVVHPLKEVLRMATKEDDEREKANRQQEREAYKVCQQKIREHNLDMKLIDAEYTFDNNKVLFYFTADGRIDFRQLVKDLAAIFKTRIELRQIGVRDETKILGGIGICGRCLCCHTYLSEFAPVSIKMAKEQSLSLNQTKISGVCGRLMCCLKNEQDTYEELNKRLPGIGDSVTTPDGLTGTVHSVNVLRQTVRVVIEENDEKEIQDYPVDDLKFRSRRKKGKNQDPDGKEAVEKKPEEPKKADKKPEDKKPSDKKSEEKKQPEGKNENRRQENKKGEPRKPEEKKAESRKQNEEKGESRKQNDRKHESRRRGEKKGQPRRSEEETTPKK